MSKKLKGNLIFIFLFLVVFVIMSISIGIKDAILICSGSIGFTFLLLKAIDLTS